MIAVPIVNVFGFVNESRYLPDRRDLNRSFPGSVRGSLTAQLAHLFMTQVVERCEYGIDFHTGSDHRTNLPQLRVDLSDAEVERLAKAFAAPVTVDAAYRDGSLRSACRAIGIPLLVFEGGEAHRFNANAVRFGVEGTLRVLAELGMLHGPVIPPDGETTIVRHSHWERARRSGIVRIDVYPGQPVQRGDVLGIIGDALGTTACCGPRQPDRHRARLHPQPAGLPGRRPRAHRRPERDRSRRTGAAAELDELGDQRAVIAHGRLADRRRFDRETRDGDVVDSLHGCVGGLGRSTTRQLEAGCGDHLADVVGSQVEIAEQHARPRFVRQPIEERAQLPARFVLLVLQMSCHNGQSVAIDVDLGEQRDAALSGLVR